MINNYFNFDISKEASVFTTTFYITVDCDIINREEDEEFVVRCWPVMDNVGILTTQEKTTKMNFYEYKTFISMFETDTDYIS